jgi:hypothetical protein
MDGQKTAKPDGILISAQLARVLDGVSNPYEQEK